MSQHKGTRPRPVPTATDSTVCPFFGWYVDAETHHAYPSMANHCHTQEPPLTIELAYQASTCLEGDWATCPRYKAAQSEGVVQRAAALPWLGRTTAQRLPIWAIATIAVAAVALIAGLFLVLRPVISAPSSPSPTSDVSMAQDTATVALDLAPTQVASPAGPSTPSLASIATEQAIAQLASPTPSPTPSPSATATSEPARTAPPVEMTPGETVAITETVVATPTVALVDTATATPTATPSPAPTRTPRPTPRPTRAVATATPKPAGGGAQFSAPVLASPADSQVFSERDQIVLQWQPVGQLAPNEYYVPTVAYLHFGDTWYDDTPWTKDTGWTLSEHAYLPGLSDNGEFRWAVRVMRRTGISAEGKPEGIAISPMSAVRTLIWRPSSSGGGGQSTPEPPPP